MWQIQGPNGIWATLKYNDSLNSFQYKQSNSEVWLTLSTGLTLEQVQDLLQSSFEGDSNISFAYDDDQNKFKFTFNQNYLNQITSELNDHKNSNSNPHNVTKSQVGLSNVPNVDARERSTHTGTQLANTISNFDDAVAKYLDRKHLQEIPEYQHNSTDYDWMIQKNITFNHPGKIYMITVGYECSRSHTGSDFRAKLKIGSDELFFHSEEFKEVNSQSLIRSIPIPFTPQNNNQIQLTLEFAGEQSGRTSRMKNAHVFIERWSA